MKKFTQSKISDKKSKNEPQRMSYETYALLKALLEDHIQKLENKFRSACQFIPSEEIVNGKVSPLDRAQRIFSAEYANLQKMKIELHTAAAATYKDHPNPEMRKFWGLE